MKLSFGDKILSVIFKCINAIIPWHKLPKYIGVINLYTLRQELRAFNLYDSYPNWDAQGTKQKDPVPEEFLTSRNSDGKYNDLDRPLMGCRGMRFGRNVPAQYVKPANHEELMHPSPRVISERLLQRKPGTFKPATIVNLLAYVTSC